MNYYLYMDEGTRTFHFIIAGTVQGVGYRYFVKQQAEELGLDGWVRNLIDGRVESMASGDELSLNKLAMQMSRGPEQAVVVSVEKYPVEQNFNFTEFKIVNDGDDVWRKS